MVSLLPGYGACCCLLAPARRRLQAYQGSVTLVYRLLAAKANPTARDCEGRLAVHWATGNKESAKCMAVLLAKQPALLNVPDEAGMTPLMWAAMEDSAPCVQRLQKLGADAEEKDMDGKTAMDWCAPPSPPPLRLPLVQPLRRPCSSAATVVSSASRDSPGDVYPLVLMLRCTLALATGSRP